MRTLCLPCFAKVNLRLHIVGRRPDGYHELRTIFQTISLHDELELELRRTPGIQLECDDPSLPTGRENLVYRALQLLLRELAVKTGVYVRLRKRIPVGRGLGGGSSNAAAALVGLLRLLRRRPPVPRLLAWAARLGADVPFFLLGGTALGIGRGEQVFPLPDLPRRTLVVVSPTGLSVNTREAYGWLAARLTKRVADPTVFTFCALCWNRWSRGLANDFEPVVFRRHPRLRILRRALLRRGAAEAALAGSGSAVFGVFPNPAQARRAAMLFPGDRVFVVQTIARGTYRRALGLHELF